MSKDILQTLQKRNIVPVACLMGISLAGGFLVAANITYGLLLALILGVLLFGVLLVAALKVPFMHVLLYLCILSSFLGPTTMVYSFGGFAFFPFRVFLLLILCYLLLMLAYGGGRVSLVHIRLHDFLGFYIFWLVYALFSLVWAVSFEGYVKNIFFLISGVLIILLMIYYFDKIKPLHVISYLWIAALTFFLLIALWEIRTGSHLPVSAYYASQWPVHTPTAVFNNTNDFATFLTLGLVFLIPYVRYCKNLWLQLGGALILGVSFYVLVTTNSRANLVAVLSVLLVLSMLSSKRVKFSLIVLLPFLAGSIYMLAPAITDYFLLYFTKIQSLMTQAAVGSINSVGVRINLIKNAIYYLFSTWGLGVGAGNAEHYIAKRSMYYTAHIVNVHNWWFEILLNYGILVFSGYVFIFIRLVRKTLYFHRRVSGPEKQYTETVLLGLAAFIPASTSSSSIMAASYQWIFFGFALALLNQLVLREEVFAGADPVHLPHVPHSIP